MPSPQRTKATPTRIRTAEREAAALDLRKTGATYEAIAHSVGYGDRSAAAKAVSRALAATIQEPADELRRLESERLDALLAAVWPPLTGSGASYSSSLHSRAAACLNCVV
jgi:AraC-like DNA-binding protein